MCTSCDWPTDGGFSARMAKQHAAEAAGGGCAATGEVTADTATVMDGGGAESPRYDPSTPTYHAAGVLLDVSAVVAQLEQLVVVDVHGEPRTPVVPARHNHERQKHAAPSVQVDTQLAGGSPQPPGTSTMASILVGEPKLGESGASSETPRPNWRFYCRERLVKLGRSLRLPKKKRRVVAAWHVMADEMVPMEPTARVEKHQTLFAGPSQVRQDPLDPEVAERPVKREAGIMHRTWKHRGAWSRLFCGLNVQEEEIDIARTHLAVDEELLGCLLLACGGRARDVHCAAKMHTVARRYVKEHDFQQWKAVDVADLVETTIAAAMIPTMAELRAQAHIGRAAPIIREHAAAVRDGLLPPRRRRWPWAGNVGSLPAPGK